MSGALYSFVDTSSVLPGFAACFWASAGFALASGGWPCPCLFWGRRGACVRRLLLSRCKAPHPQRESFAACEMRALCAGAPPAAFAAVVDFFLRDKQKGLHLGPCLTLVPPLPEPPAAPVEQPHKQLQPTGADTAIASSFLAPLPEEEEDGSKGAGTGAAKADATLDAASVELTLPAPPVASPAAAAPT